jgi:hypothetical protein
VSSQSHVFPRTLERLHSRHLLRRKSQTRQFPSRTVSSLHLCLLLATSRDCVILLPPTDTTTHGFLFSLFPSRDRPAHRSPIRFHQQLELALFISKPSITIHQRARATPQYRFWRGPRRRHLLGKKYEQERRRGSRRRRPIRELGQRRRSHGREAKGRDGRPDGEEKVSTTPFLVFVSC